MNQLVAVKDWNSKFPVGTPISIERPSIFKGKTIRRAQMKDGKAVIYADSMSGPSRSNGCGPSRRKRTPGP